MNPSQQKKTAPDDPTTRLEPVPGSASETCLNCGIALVGAYCHTCGQHTARERLSIRRLIKDFVQKIFKLDSAFSRTLVGLLKHPATVCIDYIQGRRKRYINPLVLLTVVVALELLIYKVLGGTVVAQDEETLFPLLDDYPLQAILLALGPMALVWRGLFRASGYNLAENYVFSLYLFALTELLSLSGPLVLLSFGLAKDNADEIQGIIFLVLFSGYFIYAGKDFYRQKWFVVALKFAGSILFFFLMLALGVVVVDDFREESLFLLLIAVTLLLLLAYLTWRLFTRSK